MFFTPILRSVGRTKFNMTALCPLDGRYAAQTKELGSFFSEAALIQYRVEVELLWFHFLSDNDMIRGSDNKPHRLDEDQKSTPLHFPIKNKKPLSSSNS